MESQLIVRLRGFKDFQPRILCFLSSDWLNISYQLTYRIVARGLLGNCIKTFRNIIFLAIVRFVLVMRILLAKAFLWNNFKDLVDSIEHYTEKGAGS